MKKIKKKFLLNKECFLINGVKRAAIYNLKTGNVYSVDEYAKELLNKLEGGLLLQKCLKAYDAQTQQEAWKYLIKLVRMKIGKFFYQESAEVKKVLIKKNQKIKFIWLELTEMCNLQCAHCYVGVGKRRKEKQGNLMTEEEWILVMDFFYKQECKKIQFIGGEPWQERKLLFNLIKKAREIGYEKIEIFSNLILLKPKEIEFLVKYKVDIATSIYGHQSVLHDSITAISGSFEKTVKNIKLLLKNKLKVRVGIIAMSINQDYITQILKFVRGLGVKEYGVDVVRPCGNGSNNNLIPNKLLKYTKLNKPSFKSCFLDDFCKAFCGHNCFSEKMCITSSGNFLPCVMARNLRIGNLRKSTMIEILNSQKAVMLRNLGKDKIEVCKDCEYRYCCFDCRPKAMGELKKISIKPSTCTYNPYTRRWKNENEEVLCSRSRR